MRAPRKAETPSPAPTPPATDAGETKDKPEAGMPDEVFEFVSAMDEYKRMNQRPFPNWSEVLGVLKSLGYRRVS